MKEKLIRTLLGYVFMIVGFAVTGEGSPVLGLIAFSTALYLFWTGRFNLWK